MFDTLSREGDQCVPAEGEGMQTQSRSLQCPRCGHAATIVLSEDVDPVRGTEGHAISVRCSNSQPHEPLSHVEMLRLWAADRVDASPTHLAR